jgi:hypothetical protein
MYHVQRTALPAATLESTLISLGGFLYLLELSLDIFAFRSPPLLLACMHARACNIAAVGGERYLQYCGRGVVPAIPSGTGLTAMLADPGVTRVSGPILQQ